ncbi:MAG: zinc-dependent dehydrogenase [Thermodesulfobacteriota bacterium]
MHVAMYYNNRDVRLEEMPVPQIGCGELLVKVVASGICGSDVMEWYRIKKAPLVLGHEITGEIVAVGDNVEAYKIGDRVFVSHHVPCNRCSYCLKGHHTVCDTLRTTNFDPGGFAEYIRVPEINLDSGVFILPQEMSFEEGVFIEPLACVVRGQRLARIQPGQRVLVIGSGVSGLLNIQLAMAVGAGRIVATDINEYRLDVARDLGADIVIHAKREEVPESSFDLVIVCAGALSAFTQALQSVDRGGTVLCFAPTSPGHDFTIPFYDFWRNGITLMPSYGAAPVDIRMAMELIRFNRVNIQDMITDRLGLADTAKGFRLVADAGESMKVIIEPHRSKD